MEILTRLVTSLFELEHNPDGTHSIPNTGIQIYDTDTSHYLQVTAGSNLTANRTLTLITGDAARTLTINSDTTLGGGTNTGDVTLAGTPDYITISGQVITRNKLDIADDLNAFTSAQILGVVSDETGTGALVFANTPTLVTPEIGVATGTSLDVGTTTLLASRALTVDTGGAFNVNLGGAAGDDFIIDTSTFVVESDDNQVGVGTAAPAALFHADSGGGTTPSLDGATLAVFQRNFAAGNDAVISVIAGTGGNSIINFGNSGDENIGSITYDQTNNDLYFRTNAVSNRLTIDSGGCVHINDTANANMTIGLTINQLTNDDEIVALKSSTDVSHSFTTQTENDTFFFVKKGVATAGTPRLVGVTDNNNQGAIRVEGWTNDSNTSTGKTTSAYGHVELRGYVRSGTDIAEPAQANENTVVIRTGTTTRFIFDIEGDSHQDVGTAWTNFDSDNDAILSRALGVVMDSSSIIKSKWDEWGRYNEGTLVDAGLMQHVSPEQKSAGEHSLVNMTQLARLHNGAIWQLYTKLQDTLERLEVAESKLNLLEAS